MADLEHQVAKIEGILKEVRSRLNHLEGEIHELRRTILMIFIPMWVTIILAIVFAP